MRALAVGGGTGITSAQMIEAGADVRSGTRRAHGTGRRRRLKHNTVAEAIASSKTTPGKPLFQSSGALLEGTIFGGLYFAPLLGHRGTN